MEIELSRSTYFRDILKAINSINDEITLNFNEDSLTVLSMDPSHVALIDLEIPKEAFEKWHVPEPTTRICLNIKEVLKTVFKKTYKDEMLLFEYDPNKDDSTATFTLRSDVRRIKKVPVLEPLEEEIPQPRIFFKSRARLLSKTVKRKILDDLSTSSEHLRISISDDEILFSVNSGEEKTPLERDNDNVLELKCDEESSATYTMSYLMDIFKGFQDLTEVVSLHLSEDMPIKIEVELPQGRLDYYVAPCIGID